MQGTEDSSPSHTRGVDHSPLSVMPLSPYIYNVHLNKMFTLKQQRGSSINTRKKVVSKYIHVLPKQQHLAVEKWRQISSNEKRNSLILAHGVVTKSPAKTSTRGRPTLESKISKR